MGYTHRLDLKTRLGKITHNAFLCCIHLLWKDSFGYRLKVASLFLQVHILRLTSMTHVSTQRMTDRSYALKEGWGNLSQTIRVRVRSGTGFMAYTVY